ncbi:hypothetical protein FRZ44_35490 [Hypericibacter terrae]|uniref:DUF6468 domain-containing protein n=1 Tax=Hypericibacter terrae TaxID=2602015 RepID=A0A5J6MLG3_9PROT|nr:DUF6468 domain-containing protein [Hypericibacter terrae]QEX18244.1 hypothetical protein FRZ44_35490 [Hypericibacter terrae]
MFDLSLLTDAARFMTLPMLFDGGLVLLLGVTLLYVGRLNRRIGELRRERAHFDAAIERFAGAAADTHRAMAELRQMADGEGRLLQDQVKKGAGIAEDLEFLIGRATSAADRLEGVIGHSRQAEPRKSEARGAEPKGMAFPARETAAAAPKAMAFPARNLTAAPSKDMPHTNPRDLSKATALARAIVGDRNELERSAVRGGPSTVTRRPIAVENLPEGERALLKALAGLR